MLIRPTAQRARAFLAWETRGADIDPAWLDLYGLAAEFPDPKVAIGKRPRARQLRGSTTPTLVLLAGDSRAHNIQRVEAAARLQLPHVETAVLPGVSHHGMPFVRAAALNRMILDLAPSIGRRCIASWDASMPICCDGSVTNTGG
jgi:pimeloyl-ACP methyl ester carboxylesterase